MKLIENWKAVLRKAWSIRLILLGGVFSGAEVLLPLFMDSFPRSVFAILSMITISAAFVFRLIAQKGLSDDT